MLTATALSADPAPLPAISECESCTARHKSLQRLQDARAPITTKTEADARPDTDPGWVILPPVLAGPTTQPSVTEPE